MVIATVDLTNEVFSIGLHVAKHVVALTDLVDEAVELTRVNASAVFGVVRIGGSVLLLDFGPSCVLGKAPNLVPPDGNDALFSNLLGQLVVIASADHPGVFRNIGRHDLTTHRAF